MINMLNILIVRQEGLYYHASFDPEDLKKIIEANEGRTIDMVPVFHLTDRIIQVVGDRYPEETRTKYKYGLTLRKTIELLQSYLGASEYNKETFQLLLDAWAMLTLAIGEGGINQLLDLPTEKEFALLLEEKEE